MKKRVFIIVLDSAGIGALPDAADFGDAGANTLKSISKSDKFSIPTLKSLGYCNIDGVLPDGTDDPKAAYARLAERSKGKDTTIGHWEIAGVVSEKPLPVFPDGFPAALVEAFESKTGLKMLCNKPYSGTDVIRDFGMEHIKTGNPILYTSADSVFQLAAHEEHFGLQRLYDICTEARALLTGEWGVGRVIARPFTGETPDTFKRTTNRHDFSLEPPARTLLDVLCDAGMDVIGVGKIYDIFAGKSVTKTYKTTGNADGMAKTDAIADSDFHGLCFVNLVDFDMLYGHRNDVDGYAAAMTAFDTWLNGFLKKLRPDDALMITADHGCDPAFPGTDHTREYVPLIITGEGIKPGNLGTRETYADIASTAAALLGVNSDELAGEDLLAQR